MTDADEPKGRRRHILKRSDRQALDAGLETTPPAAETAAEEPKSGAVEEMAVAETVEAPVADEPVADEPVADEPVADEPVADEPVADEPVDDATEVVEEPATEDTPEKGSTPWARVLAFGVVPVVAVVLAAGVGWLAFADFRAARIDTAQEQAIQAARDSTIALLSYNPDTVEQQLTDARGLLTGEFKDSYTSLTNDVVIPGAKEQRISAVATVPAAAAVSTETDDAVVLVYVNQTVVVGDTQPTATLSSVRVTLENVDGKWLISKFDPV